MTTRRAHLCMAAECNVVTLQDYCWRHRQPDLWQDKRREIDTLLVPEPAGSWAISAQIKAEDERP